MVLAYDKISAKAQEKKESVSASFDRIEGLVDSCFKLVRSDNGKQK
jgi:hypothetical protein